MRTPTSERSRRDHGEPAGTVAASHAPHCLTNALSASVQDVIHRVISIEAAAWGRCPAAREHPFGNQTILDPLAKFSRWSAVHPVLEIKITPCQELRDQLEGPASQTWLIFSASSVSMLMACGGKRLALRMTQDCSFCRCFAYCCPGQKSSLKFG